MIPIHLPVCCGGRESEGAVGAVEDGLGDAAGEEVEDECQPEGVVAEEGE